MSSIEEIAELDEIRSRFGSVPVVLVGLRGYKGGFEVLLHGAPRVGEYLDFYLPRRRGRGRYVVQQVEWQVREHYHQVVAHLTEERESAG